MAGIAAFFARESIPDFDVIMKPMIDSYITHDTCNFDAMIVDPENPENVQSYDCQDIRSICKNRYEEIRNFYDDKMEVGSLLMFGIDTEIAYDGDCECGDFVAVLNHSSNKYAIGDQILTAQYIAKNYNRKFHKNMKKTLEDNCETDINMLAFDSAKKFLMSANDGHQGLQMCHAYVKGYGFMLHENMVCLRNIIHTITACSEDACNMWETWYGHPLESEVIRESDLISGNMRKIKFNPKYSY